MYRYSAAYHNHFRRSGMICHHGPFTCERRVGEIVHLIDIDGNKFSLHESWLVKAS